jgi:hypothetical protein
MGRRKYTDQQLVHAVSTCRTMRDILVRLGMAPYGGNYETVRHRAETLGLEITYLRRGKTPNSCSNEELAVAVRTSRSLAQVLAKLGLKPGGNQGRVKRRIADLGLDTSHFVGEAWRRGATTPVVPPKPLEEYLVKGRLVHTSGLKKRLIAEGLKEWRCEQCRRTTWNGRSIPLELDHINGRRDDNRLANLRVICPNCHAQTDTYRGRNIGVPPPRILKDARVPERYTEAS